MMPVLAVLLTLLAPSLWSLRQTGRRSYRPLMLTQALPFLVPLERRTASTTPHGYLCHLPIGHPLPPSRCLHRRTFSLMRAAPSAAIAFTAQSAFRDQAIGVHLPIRLSARLPERLEEGLAILVIQENGFRRSPRFMRW